MECMLLSYPWQLSIKSISRWIRLLFGREFYLPSVLQLWDALFVDGTSLSLVDYIFVTMLIQIRHTCKLINYTCYSLILI